MFMEIASATFLGILNWRHRYDGKTEKKIPRLRPLPAIESSWPKDPVAKEALNVFRAELRYFSPVGSRRLYELIRRGYKPGVTWYDSPLSFRMGFHGSSISDFRGRTENAFTTYWRENWSAIDPLWLLVEIKYAIENQPKTGGF